MDTRSLDAQLEDDAKRLEELRYIVILWGERGRVDSSLTHFFRFIMQIPSYT
jgi:hypothetical protein